MARMPSNMAHQFSQVPRAEIPRSSFDRSHGYKTTLDSGYLVPVFVDEALPGDTFSLNMTIFARLSTPLHPIMDNMQCDAFFFFVPYRLVWTHFVNFMGEEAVPGDHLGGNPYLCPQMQTPAGGYAQGSIFDYMGLPVANTNTTATTLPVLAANYYAHNVFHLRAYNLIWNQWFRDENLQNPVTVTLGDTGDAPTDFTLLRRGKRHDYFTASLPFPQKGPAVTLPLGTSAAVRTSPGTAGTPPLITGAQVAMGFNTAAGVAATPGTTIGVGGGSLANIGPTGFAGTAGIYPNNLYADLSTATAATINQLRSAFQIQRMYERDARGGTRYTELIHAHFGVTSPDARLQRAEYLGGGTVAVNVNPIAQTSGQVTGTGVSSSTPLGNLGAIGTVSMHRIGFTKSFTEHGVLLGLISIRADLNYQQGLNRMWQRQTRFDFYWPALSHIGEQAVLNNEIFCQGISTGSYANVPGNTITDFQPWGYQERFAEYRYKPSLITGQFRSNYLTPLDSWHLAETYSALPVLGPTFIQSQPPIARVVAVTNQPQFLFDSYTQLRCARPMPVYGVPGMIDHF